jgi:hypothetical protein
VASRDTKTNIFQEGSAGFKATIGLNKRKYIQVMSTIIIIILTFVGND